MRRRGLIALLLIALSLSGCDRAPAKISAVGFYLNTVVTITAYCEQSVLDGALKECARYEAMLSKTVQGSDVWRVNHACGQPVAVSEDTLRVLDVARRVSEASDGAFDVTVAGASALWDFSGDGGLPDEKALAEAASRIDYRRIVIRKDTVTLPEGVMIDLGGVAKGYIADRVRQWMKEQGVKHAVLNFGGNVATLGARPDGTPWSIGVQDPMRETGEEMLTVDSADGSVVTSGVYERSFTLDGVLYHHILDTKTGMPVQNALASATVLSESSALGDALSTACMALGEEKALDMARDMDGVEIVLIRRDGAVLRSDQ